ncbi:MAG: hypothetical protein ACRC62_33885 [Microcoleus sp.]
MKSSRFADLSMFDRLLSGSGVIQFFDNESEFDAGMLKVPMDALTNRGKLQIVLKDGKPNGES